MSRYTMMGASTADVVTPSYDGSGINPNPTTETTTTETPTDSSLASGSPATYSAGANEGANEVVDTSDIPNTPDNIIQAQKESSYAMLFAAVALAFIFLKKKKK